MPGERSVVRALKRRLRRTPRLHRLARTAAAVGALRAVVVLLSPGRLPPSRFEEIERDPDCHDVIGDLLAFTGLSREELAARVLRRGRHHHESEFDWRAPATEKALTWFYRSSESYLFGNAIHPYDRKLDVITQGRVLDFGAGAGCHTIGLASRGLEVDFVEVSPLQADFIRFRAARRGMTNVRHILPYHDGVFDPVRCITGYYDAIVAMDVLEHIPQYHVVVRHLVGRLKPGGLIFENSPFDPDADDVAIHLKATMPIAEAMRGMTRLGAGLWRRDG